MHKGADHGRVNGALRLQSTDEEVRHWGLLFPVEMRLVHGMNTVDQASGHLQVLRLQLLHETIPSLVSNRLALPSSGILAPLKASFGYIAHTVSMADLSHPEVVCQEQHSGGLRRRMPSEGGTHEAEIRVHEVGAVASLRRAVVEKHEEDGLLGGVAAEDDVLATLLTMAPNPGEPRLRRRPVRANVRAEVVRLQVRNVPLASSSDGRREHELR
mmetsp:Transcript_76334/g.163705  ORF Transcript_76334/g.163705 Transcript_76334/m.163705 type:complete len:214 (+) Transcript_76334:1873-2514(+)